MDTEIFSGAARVEPAVVFLTRTGANSTSELVGYEVSESSEQLVEHVVARNRARVILLRSCRRT
jgi:hypothetical protein